MAEEHFCPWGGHVPRRQSAGPLPMGQVVVKIPFPRSDCGKGEALESNSYLDDLYRNN